MSVIINGSAGVTTNSGAVYDSLQRGTPVTASGTSVDFTSIPSWVRRITVMFNGVSTNGTSNAPMIQLGDAGGVETSGYTGYVSYVGATTLSSANSAGFLLNFGTNAASATTGIATICNITGNTWVLSWTGTYENAAFTVLGSGTKTLSPGVLDRVRITTVNGTDTFDAGTINIIYE